MSEPPGGDWSSDGFAFFGVAGVVVVLAAIHAYRVEYRFSLEVAEAIIPTAMATVFVYFGWRVRSEAFPVASRALMLAIALAVGLAGLIISAIVVVLQAFQGDPLADPLYVLFISTVGAAAVGAPVGYFAVKNQRMIDELAASNASIRSLNQRLSVAQRVFRHNLRNDLTVMMGFTDAVLEDPDRENAGDLLSRVQAKQARLSRLAEEIAEIDRIWSSEPTTVDLGPTLRDVAAEARRAFPAATVETDVTEHLEVRAVPGIERAVQEAVENALTHNDPGDVTVAIAAERLGPDRVSVTVTDDGVGIPDFETDAIGALEETALEHGTGLGLWLMYFAAERSGGDLSVRRRDSGGTLVDFRLPTADGAHGAEGERLLAETGEMASRMAAVMEATPDGTGTDADGPAEGVPGSEEEIPAADGSGA